MEKVMVRNCTKLTALGFGILGVLIFWGTQLHASDVEDELQRTVASAIVEIVSLRTSPQVDSQDERSVVDDILAKYVPMLIDLEKQQDSTLTDIKAEQDAYLRIRFILEVLADAEGNQDEILSLKEIQNLNSLIEKTPGLIIFKRILREKDLWFVQDPESMPVSPVPENQTICTDLY